MKVKEVMTENPATCAPDTSLRDVARLMVECDCGEIPIVEKNGGKPIGVITDRDITCRTVAEGKNPLDLKASDIMSEPVVTATPQMDLEECCQILEKNQIRRIPVVDDSGRICGIVAQADLAQKAPEHETAEVVRDVSRPSPRASAVA